MPHPPIESVPSEALSAVQTQILKALNFRHACKIMDENRKIPAQDFAVILESARLSPSSFGFEPWKFLIVQTPALRDKIKPVVWGAQNTLPTASHFVIALARTSKSMRYDRPYIQNIMKNVHHLPPEVVKMRGGFYQQFQESDFGLLESDRALFDWATKQTYIALANMMNTAALMEIDTCPIEGFKQQAMDALLSSEFKVDTSEFKTAYMLAFGYRVNPQNVKTRQAIDTITEWF